MILVSEESYIDENGLPTTSKLYVDKMFFLRGASGSGYFRNDKETQYIGGTVIGNRYEFAEYSFTATNPVGMAFNFSVYVDVNVKGVPKYK